MIDDRAGLDATATDAHGWSAAARDISMVLSQALSLLADDRPRDAIAAIESATHELRSGPEATVSRLLMCKGQAYRELEDWESAIKAFAAALAIRPDDEGVLDQIYLMSVMAKRFAQAESYKARLQAIQARQLPERLADGLAQIWKRTGGIELDDGALEWAWELADKSVWDRAAWRAAAAWGKEARLLLRSWWEAAPLPQLRQLDDLLEQPDNPGLLAAMLESSACLLVGAHVGPTAVAVSRFRSGNRPFRTVGTADRDRAYGDTVIPFMPNSMSTVRTIIDKIRSGATIGLLADSPSARSDLTVEFLGRRVRLPRAVPKLIQTYGARSFWCCPLWRGGRITVELERLPDPLHGEPFDLWCQRWFEAYLAQLETVMRGAPENLGLFSGIWSNVNVTALGRRRNAGGSAFTAEPVATS